MGQQESLPERDMLDAQVMKELSDETQWAESEIKVLYSWFQLSTGAENVMGWDEWLVQFNPKHDLPHTFSSRVFLLALCVGRGVDLSAHGYQLIHTDSEQCADLNRSSMEKDRKGSYFGDAALNRASLRESLFFTGYDVATSTNSAVMREAIEKLDAVEFREQVRKAKARKVVSEWANAPDIKYESNTFAQQRESEEEIAKDAEKHKNDHMTFEEFVRFLHMMEIANGETRAIWVFAIYQVNGCLWPGHLLKIGRMVASALMPDVNYYAIIECIKKVFKGHLSLDCDEWKERVAQLRIEYMKTRSVKPKKPPKREKRGLAQSKKALPTSAKKKGLAMLVQRRMAKRVNLHILSGGFGLYAHLSEYIRQLRARTASFICRGRLWVGRHRRYVTVENNSIVIGVEKNSLVDAEVYRLIEVTVVQHPKKPYKFEIVFRNGKRIHFRAATPAAGNAWCNAIITNTVDNPGLFRFGSFAPPRVIDRCKWYQDGCGYYRDLHDSLLRATSEILISDWSFSPEIYLVRDTSDRNNRLDLLLEQKSREGVQIHILLWWEVAQGGSVDSNYVIHRFKRSPNIHVVRHPGSTIPSRWSHHQKCVVIDRQISFLGGIDLCFGRFDDQEHNLIDDNYLCTRFPGKDYYNPSIYPCNELSKPFQESRTLDRLIHPRQPWHDIQVGFDGPAARDIGRNFVQRWNHHVKELAAHLPLLAPVVPTEDPRPSPFPALNCKSSSPFHVQAVRSISKWSGGVDVPEASIYECYQHIIMSSKHYLYIENQYFISSTGPVQNIIAELIVARICKAIDAHEPYKVYIILPMYPEGDFHSSPSLIVFNYARKTFRFMRQELIKRHPTVNVSDYLSINSILNHGQLADRFFVQMIYVHSKLLIADDRMVLISSANVNDRSMMGDHDSELGLFIDDSADYDGLMNGQPYKCSSFAHSLRVSLWQEHLGLSENQLQFIQDPVSEMAYERMWKGIAEANAKLIEPIVDIKAKDIFETCALGHDASVKRESVVGDMVKWIKGKRHLHEHLNGICHCCLRQHDDVLPCVGCAKLTCQKCLFEMQKCHLCSQQPCTWRKKARKRLALGGVSSVTLSAPTLETRFQGWLERITAEKTRYLRVFAVIDSSGALDYFSDEGAKRHVGKLVLARGMLAVAEKDPLQFSVGDPQSAQSAFNFLAETEQERNLWVDAVNELEIVKGRNNGSALNIRATASIATVVSPRSARNTSSHPEIVSQQNVASATLKATRQCHAPGEHFDHEVSVAGGPSDESFAFSDSSMSRAPSSVAPFSYSFINHHETEDAHDEESSSFDSKGKAEENPTPGYYMSSSSSSLDQDMPVYDFDESAFLSLGADPMGADILVSAVEDQEASKHTTLGEIFRRTLSNLDDAKDKVEHVIEEAGAKTKKVIEDAGSKTKNFLEGITHTRVERRLNEVRGHLVPYPIREKPMIPKDIFNLMSKDALFL